MEISMHHGIPNVMYVSRVGNQYIALASSDGDRQSKTDRQTQIHIV